jgi:hypothetical protein
MTNLAQESHCYWISSICSLKKVMQSSLVILLYTTATLIVKLAQTNLHTLLEVCNWSAITCMQILYLYVQTTSKS